MGITKRFKKSGPLVQWGVILGSLVGVAAVISYLTKEQQYVPGPYGERKTLIFSSPPFGGEYFGQDLRHKREFDFDNFRYMYTSLESYKNASEGSKKYIDRALLNYRWGYTFPTADSLLATLTVTPLNADKSFEQINEAIELVYGLALVWPLQKVE